MNIWNRYLINKKMFKIICFFKILFNFALPKKLNLFIRSDNEYSQRQFLGSSLNEPINALSDHAAIGFVLLCLMQKLRKIHKGIATKVCSNKAKLRAFAIYLDLHGLYNEKSIHNFQRRIPQIANTFDISTKTFKKWLTVILKYGWAKIDGTTLLITGRRKVAKLIGNVSEKDYHVIQAGNFKDIELHLRCLAIEENKKSQHHAINKKVIDREVKKAKITCKGIQKKFAKTLNTEKLKSKLRAVNILTPINTQITVSRQGLANIYNLKTAKSGTYWAKKLKKYLIDEAQKIVFLGSMSNLYFRELQLASKRYLFMENGICYCRLPNHVSYLPYSKTADLQRVCK